MEQTGNNAREYSLSMWLAIFMKDHSHRPHDNHCFPVVSSRLPSVFSQSRLKCRPSLPPLSQEDLSHSLSLPTSVPLSDLITVRVLARPQTRLVLQASSLRLYVLHQLPVDTYCSRERVEVWLADWQRMSHRELLGIRDVHWNRPEGCVSVVEDYANAGSLKKLIVYMGALPERTLLEVASQLVKAVGHLQDQGLIHGHISASQLLFNRAGDVRLAPGLYERLASESTSVLQSDIRAIGRTLLEALCGAELPTDMDESCCTLHSLLQTHSEPFLLRVTVLCHNFLCSCLRACPLVELTQHPWLHQAPLPGLAVKLEELLAVAGRLEMADTLTAGGERELGRISRALALLDKPQCADRESAADLAAELGCSAEQVLNRLCK